MGKGQNVAKGVEAAGGKAVVVPGMGADMRLGDVMQQEHADMGISFCGSGGAGALTAATKYGYPERHGMRSIEEGITAIKDGKTVLGFGFMDQEELGKRLTEEFIKKHGKCISVSRNSKQNNGTIKRIIANRTSQCGYFKGGRKQIHRTLSIFLLPTATY